MSIRIAVIGAGVMGSDHARIVAEDLLGAVLQVVFHVAEDRARKITDAYGWLSIKHEDVLLNSLEGLEKSWHSSRESHPLHPAIMHHKRSLSARRVDLASVLD